MKTLIFANGDPPSPRMAQFLASLHEEIIATDGAADRLIPLEILPHVVCGDFDSVSETARVLLPNTLFLPTPDQDHADLEKAIGLARKRGAAQITLTGTGGGRLDHLLSSYALLLRYHREIPIQIVEDCGRVFALSGETTFPAFPGDTLSLISFDGTAEVTLHGVEWELTDHRLDIGTHGVSNQVTGVEVFLSVSGGAVFVCHLPRNSFSPLPFG